MDILQNDSNLKLNEWGVSVNIYKKTNRALQRTTTGGKAKILQREIIFNVIKNSKSGGDKMATIAGNPIRDCNRPPVIQKWISNPSHVAYKAIPEIAKKYDVVIETICCESYDNVALLITGTDNNVSEAYNEFIRMGNLN